MYTHMYMYMYNHFVYIYIYTYTRLREDAEVQHAGLAGHDLYYDVIILTVIVNTIGVLLFI